jgi:hypothetical protein
MKKSICCCFIFAGLLFNAYAQKSTQKPVSHANPDGKSGFTYQKITWDVAGKKPGAQKTTNTSSDKRRKTSKPARPSLMEEEGIYYRNHPKTKPRG